MKIIRMYEKGLTYSQIGKEVGGNRHQIAGIISRLKYSGDIKEGRIKPKDPAPLKPEPKKAKRATEEPVKEPKFHNIERIFKEAIPLLELKPDQCKYPIWCDDEGHVFCGKEKTADSSYCADHKKECIVPARIYVKKWGIRERSGGRSRGRGVAMSLARSSR